jgi:tetratricopeptide (TPR) repeat protein
MIDPKQVVGELVGLARTRPDLALQRAEDLLARAPDFVPVRCLAARLARRAGDLDRAGLHLEAALARDPDAPPALAEMGTLAAMRNDFPTAARCYRTLVERGGDHPDLWINLALAEEKLGRFEAAIDAYGRALSVDLPDASEIRARLAGVLAMAGREAEARAEYLRVLDDDADDATAHFGLGMLELAAGKPDAGLERFRRAVECRPGFAEAWQQILETRKLEDADDAALAAVRALLAQDDLPAGDRERLGFAMGKACDDLGLYDEAFAHYESANRLKRDRLPRFDRDAWAAEVEAMLDAAPGPGAGAGTTGFRRASVQPIFIVGMPRSGTTLIDQILTSHPRVGGVGELAFFDERRATTGRAEEAGSGDDESLREAYLARLIETGGESVTNKYPANFRHLPLIRRLLPEARIILVVRNALDTCLSIYFQDFPTGNLYANDLRDIAAYYRGYRRLAEAWAGLGSGVFRIEYERLLEDQEGATRRLLAYCGLRWSDECMHFERNPRPVATLSRWQVRQPIYGSSAGRWRRYESHLSSLREALGAFAD